MDGYDTGKSSDLMGFVLFVLSFSWKRMLIGVYILAIGCEICFYRHIQTIEILSIGFARKPVRPLTKPLSLVAYVAWRKNKKVSTSCLSESIHWNKRRAINTIKDVTPLAVPEVNVSFDSFSAPVVSLRRKLRRGLGRSDWNLSSFIWKVVRRP